MTGRGLGASGRGHHGGAVGHAGLAFDRVGPEQEESTQPSRLGAIGRSRASILRARKGCPSDREVGGAPADQGARGGGGRGDADLLHLPGGALAAHPHQKSARPHPARDQAAHRARGWGLPGWAIGPEPRRGAR